MRSIAILPLLLVTACASNYAPPGEHIGQPVQNLEVQQLAHVSDKPEDHFKQTLLVEAKVKAVCQSMGCWMQVEDGPYTAMVRWETGCGGKYAFPKDAAGERILIQGSFYPKEIAPEDMEHLKKEAGQQLDIPEKGYEFNANAVVLLDRK